MVFGLVAGFGNVTNQTVLYIEAPAEKVGTASGLLRTFGYIGSIAAATITGVAFRVRVSEPGYFVAVMLIATGLVVLLLTLLDRQLAVPEQDRPHSRSSDATAISLSHRAFGQPRSLAAAYGGIVFNVDGGGWGMHGERG